MGARTHRRQDARGGDRAVLRQTIDHRFPRLKRKCASSMAFPKAPYTSTLRLTAAPSFKSTTTCPNRPPIPLPRVGACCWYPASATRVRSIGRVAGKAQHESCVRVPTARLGQPRVRRLAASSGVGGARAAPDTLIAAHSLGCLLVAHWLARTSVRIAGALLVAIPDPERRQLPAPGRRFLSAASEKPAVCEHRRRQHR